MKFIPRVIKSDIDHKATLARIDQIFAAAPGSPQSAELDLLTTLVEAYEADLPPENERTFREVLFTAASQE